MNSLKYYYKYCRLYESLFFITALFRNMAFTASLLSFMFFLSGCGTIAVTKITSTPSGALITLDRHYLGKTPITCKVKGKPGFDNVYKFLAIKEGYIPQEKVFKEPPFALFRRVKYAIPPKIHFTLKRAPQNPEN